MAAGRDDLGDPEGIGEDEAEAHVRGVCFKTGPPERTGVELEWLVHDRASPHDLISADRLQAALAPVSAPGALPRGSRLTLEPGGQVELSSAPAPALGACVEAMTTDLAVLRQAAERAGLVLVGRGMDPYREPPRVLDHPRYRAMEDFFDREGPWGRTMMRRTASLQVNVDCGDESQGVTGHRRRWALAHRIGPVLVAAFANSPMRSGEPTGWLSTRQATWARMDPGRTRHPRHHPDPGTAWADYALDARLLCIRESAEPQDARSADPAHAGPAGVADASAGAIGRTDGSGDGPYGAPGGPDAPPAPGSPGASGASHARSRTPDDLPAGARGDERTADWSAPPGLTFRDWVRGTHLGLRRPTLADLDYHLSTLFPPVRPRGWLELRMIDAQDGDGWVVPTLVAATLLDDPVAADAAYAATEPLCADSADRDPLPGDEVWQRAARTALADADIAEATRGCFAAVDTALSRTDAPAHLRRALADFTERYPERGRCPAQDKLDALSRV